MPLDISEVRRLTSQAERSLARAPGEMKRILDRAARAALADKTYQDRSRNLRESTAVGEVLEAGDQAAVVFGAAEEYASFVERRGFSDVEGRAAEAATEIEYFLDAEAEKLGAL